MNILKSLCFTLLLTGIFACESANSDINTSLIGDWQLSKSEFNQTIKNNKPVSLSFDLSSNNYILSFLADGSIKVKFDKGSEEVLTQSGIFNIQDINSNKAKYSISSNIITLIASDNSTSKFIISQPNSKTIVLTQDKTFYMEQLKAEFQKNEALFKLLGQTVEGLVKKTEDELLEYNTKITFVKI